MSVCVDRNVFVYFWIEHGAKSCFCCLTPLSVTSEKMGSPDKAFGLCIAWWHANQKHLNILFAIILLLYNKIMNWSIYVILLALFQSEWNGFNSNYLFIELFHKNNITLEYWINTAMKTCCTRLFQYSVLLVCVSVGYKHVIYLSAYSCAPSISTIDLCSEYQIVLKNVGGLLTSAWLALASKTPQVSCLQLEMFEMVTKLFWCTLLKQRLPTSAENKKGHSHFLNTTYALCNSSKALVACDSQVQCKQTETLVTVYVCGNECV